MATDFDRLVYVVQTLHQDVLNLGAVVAVQNEQLNSVAALVKDLSAFIAVQNEQLNSFAALVKDLVQARETERAQFAALLQQLVETTGGMVTELQQQVGAAFQIMQQALDGLKGR